MKLYPYPKPQPHLRRRATSKGRPEVYWDHSTRVLRTMGRNALRRIHEVHKTTGRFPTVDELQEWVLDHHPQARREFDKVDAMAEDAAVFALGVFDVEEYERRVQRARNGGKMSGHKKGARGRRPVAFTVEDLRKVEHLSIREQAEALGCSEATISRRRRDLKAHKAAELDAAVDEVMGPIPETSNEASQSDPEARITDMAPDKPTPEWTLDEISADPDAYRAQAEDEAIAALDAEKFLAGLDLSLLDDLTGRYSPQTKGT
ncbi:hypothetical protein [Microbacterium sp. MTN4-26]|uniref:hypothetical protein n=1 Tax=unclassified Microbacterium TaxID=2609290 RepID=UPI0036F2A4B4